MNKVEQNPDDTTNEIEQKSSNDKCVVTGIYGLRNKTNGKWYIGYSNDIIRRWKGAYEKAKCVGQKKIYGALKKYGYDAFDKVILEECSDDRSVWGPKESYWITKYDSVENGYNIASGGCGGATRTGLPCSEETKKKISVRHRGRTLTREHSENISLGLTRLNKSISMEHQQKLQQGRGLPKYSDEKEAFLQKQRIRQARFRQKHSKKITFR